MNDFNTENDASNLIYRVGRLLRYKAAGFFAAQGSKISPEQWGVLLKIRELEPTPMSGLVDQDLNDHPNVTRLVCGLEELGYAQRSPNPEDRRSLLVSTTQEGREFLDSTLPLLQKEKARFYEGLSDRETDLLVKMLQVVENNLRK